MLYYDQAIDTDAASKTKYTCPECGLHAWAKPEAPLICGSCEEPTQAESVEGEEDE